MHSGYLFAGLLSLTGFILVILTGFFPRKTIEIQKRLFAVDRSRIISDWDTYKAHSRLAGLVGGILLGILTIHCFYRAATYHERRRVTQEALRKLQEHDSKTKPQFSQPWGSPFLAERDPNSQ
ncbi:MAG: hypothetical protein ACYSUC_03860 [Planctomycetota bacterium]|jgi:hypothetical protein